MSNVGEIITAVTQLSPAEQWDIYQWLNESPAITRRRLDALREDVALGLAQADRGDVAPLDIEAVKAEVRRANWLASPTKSPIGAMAEESSRTLATRIARSFRVCDDNATR